MKNNNNNFNVDKELKNEIDEMVLYVGSSLEGDDDEHFDNYFDAIDNLIIELPNSDISIKNQNKIIDYINTLNIKQIKKIFAPMMIKKLYKEAQKL